MQTKHPYAKKPGKPIYWLWGILAIALLLLSGCSNPPETGLATPLPTEYIPTVIALTLEAGLTVEPPPSESIEAPSPTVTQAEQATATAPAPAFSPTPSPTHLPLEPSATPYTLPPPATATPHPIIPNAEIEIRNLGELSRVTSPLHVYSYLRTGDDGRVMVELLGEDSRLLYREVKVIDYAPAGGHAVFLADIDYEIPGVAEVGHLRLSVNDEYGRTYATNSVALILLAIGDFEILPPADVLSQIVIQEPTRRKLIQGDKLLVSGLARVDREQPLLVTILDSKGKIVGQRLAGVEIPPDGGYGPFAVEVTYNIDSLTNARITVTKSEPGLNEVTYLSSVDVMLSP